MDTPARSARSCGSIGTPPYTAALVIFVWYVSPWIVSSICTASSRVGARISARVPASCWSGTLNSRCRIGSTNAIVLPEPVSADASTSSPARAYGMTALCTGRVSRYPMSFMPWSREGETWKDVNGTGDTSTGASSRAEYVGGGGMRRPPREPEAPEDDGPRRRRGALEREVGEAKLPCAEGDDAANRVVGRDAHGNPIAWHDFDAEPPHAATELGKYLVARIALYAVEPTAVYRDDGTLNVN